MFRTNPGFTHQIADKKLFSPRRGRIALSANERIDEFPDFAIQAKFAYVNKLRNNSCVCKKIFKGKGSEKNEQDEKKRRLDLRDAGCDAASIMRGGAFRPMRRER